MRKSFKYRIYLSNGQRRILAQQFEVSRWVYNETLAERKRAYEERGESLRVYDTQAMLPIWKRTKPELKLIHSQVLQNISVRVDLAFQAFFRRVKAGAETVGFPRFKGFGRYDSLTYPQYGNGVRLEGTRLILSKVGAVHVVLHRPVEGTPKTVTLTRSRTGTWFAVFSCEVDVAPLPPTDAVVGVDVGLASFATLSTGEEIANPRFYRRDEADLKRVQQRKDAAKNAQDWPENAKQKGILAKIHARIANRRADFAHKRSRALVNAYQVIVFEDLAPQEMGRSRGMRKSIMDVAWTQFIQMTIAKAEEAGRQVILVNPRDTTKMCSSCGKLVQKALRDRIHTCPHCGLVLGRDHNAARNILYRGLPSLRL
ncbi:RNA-guided endonuclease InsQ/TnpB family protein [Candidatus Oscillochloris fontis]|uniref:RNA-guided endonuclease InsQ/TnpB family protein n=1 Tax=Candidatus Oscillochloris fontis TaxID=2496868 RepID=UPI00101BDACF|nr:RNA-guided endonuclease TnpB family protein [Candidatus Oscillochloris fontis]